MKLVHIEDRTHDYIYLNITFNRGSFSDTAGKEGTAFLALKMLSRGTVSRTRDEFHEELTFIGSSMRTQVNFDHMRISCDCRRDTLGNLMELVQDMILRPSFSESEFQKLKNRHSQQLQDALDSDSVVLSHFTGRALFEGLPMSKPSPGTRETIRNIELEDVRDFHRNFVTAEDLLVGVCGNISKEDALEVMTPIFDALDRTSPPPAIERPAYNRPGTDMLFVHREGRSQAHLSIARLFPKTEPCDLVRMIVANTAFGDTFTSPLVREIREKRGWSYGVDSLLSSGRQTGLHMMSYAPGNETTVPAIELGRSLLEDALEDGIETEDIDFARNYLTNRFPFSIETTRQRLLMELKMILTDRSDDYLDRYTERVKETSPEQANAAFSNRLRSQRSVITVVGDRALLEPLSNMTDIDSFREIPHNWTDDLPPR